MLPMLSIITPGTTPAFCSFPIQRGNVIYDELYNGSLISVTCLMLQCSFDRECCKGLECSMSASQAGVGLSCQRGWLADPDRGDMVWETPDSAPKEPKSDDGNWMVVKSEEAKEIEDHRESTEDKNEKVYSTDMLTEIENLQAKKKLKLLRENYELEKLFTEREEKELEQLRALREDAEMDELRRLKELRLKRKMQLIKELKELRGLKAEEGLHALKKFNKVTNASKTEEPTINRQNDVLDDNYSNSSNPSNISVDQMQTPDAVDPQEGGSIPIKHKQGIHEVHHKRKHHHHKRKDPHTSLNSTTQTEIGNPEKKKTLLNITQDE